MTVLEKVKAAAARLAPDEQAELFRWWVESEGFKTRQLAEDIGRAGRERLKKQQA